jgi:hypothetical protein
MEAKHFNESSNASDERPAMIAALTGGETCFLAVALTARLARSMLFGSRRLCSKF